MTESNHRAPEGIREKERERDVGSSRVGFGVVQPFLVGPSRSQGLSEKPPRREG